MNGNGAGRGSVGEVDSGKRVFVVWVSVRRVDRE